MQNTKNMAKVSSNWRMPIETGCTGR